MTTKQISHQLQYSQYSDNGSHQKSPSIASVTRKKDSAPKQEGTCKGPSNQITPSSPSISASMNSKKKGSVHIPSLNILSSKSSKSKHDNNNNDTLPDNNTNSQTKAKSREPSSPHKPSSHSQRQNSLTPTTVPSSSTTSTSSTASTVSSSSNFVAGASGGKKTNQNEKKTKSRTFFQAFFRAFNTNETKSSSPNQNQSPSPTPTPTPTSTPTSPSKKEDKKAKNKVEVTSPNPIYDDNNNITTTSASLSGKSSNSTSVQKEKERKNEKNTSKSKLNKDRDMSYDSSMTIKQNKMKEKDDLKKTKNHPKESKLDKIPQNSLPKNKSDTSTSSGVSLPSDPELENPKNSSSKSPTPQAVCLKKRKDKTERDSLDDVPPQFTKPLPAIPNSSSKTSSLPISVPVPQKSSQRAPVRTPPRMMNAKVQKRSPIPNFGSPTEEVSQAIQIKPPSRNTSLSSTTITITTTTTTRQIVGSPKMLGFPSSSSLDASFFGLLPSRSVVGRSTSTPMNTQNFDPYSSGQMQTGEDSENSMVLARGLHDFSGEILDDLTFWKGDIIAILAMYDDGWWLGFLDGNVGKIPSNYVEVLPPHYFLATITQDYYPQNKDELRLEESDLVLVTKKKGERYYGEFSGNQGWFPQYIAEQVTLLPNASGSFCE